MKINIKAKDFSDKEKLQKTLSTKLKKPMQHLEKTPGAKLPFCYEVGYFEDGSGFLCIGETKEVQRIYKTQRCKGNGTEGKIDKKKVAMGEVLINDQGVYEFYVQQGTMKNMQAKQVIKGIDLLKKKIKDNFVIRGGEVGTTETDPQTSTEAEDNTETPRSTELPQDQIAKINKMKDNLQTLASSVGKAAKGKIQSNLDRFAGVIDGWKQEFEELATEQLENLKETIQSIQEELLGSDDAPTITITEEQRNKMNQNLDLMMDKVNSFLEQLETIQR